MKTLYIIISISIVIWLIPSCSSETDSLKSKNEANQAKIVYTAELTSLNQNISGLSSKGYAKFQIQRDTVYVSIKMVGTSPNTKHWQHLYGFEDGHTSTCSSIANDYNEDGVVDVEEIKSTSGIPMIPFNMFPAQLDFEDDSYSISDKNGSYTYQANFLLKDLEEKFAEKYNGEGVSWENRVLYVYGIAEYIELPETLQATSKIASKHASIPIACGKLVRKD